MDPLIRLQIYRRPVHFTASFISRETRAVHTFQEIQIPSQLQIQTQTFQEIQNSSQVQIETHIFQDIKMPPSQLQIQTQLLRNTNTMSCAITETKNLKSKLAFFKLFKNGTTAWQKEEVTGASRRL